jgi:F-type H+-transporting ATPase subunit delta
MTDNRARADRYAQAVLQAMVERWQSALGEVVDAVDSDPKLAGLLSDKGKSVEAKNKALAAQLPPDTPAEISNLLSLLVQEDDLALLPDIAGALTEAASGQSAPIKAEITSAMELSADDQERISQSLIKEYGDGLVFSFQVDPSLLGGLRVRVGDRLMDNSVASRLTKLRESIASVVR